MKKDKIKEIIHILYEYENQSNGLTKNKYDVNNLLKSASLRIFKTNCLTIIKRINDEKLNIKIDVFEELFDSISKKTFLDIKEKIKFYYYMEENKS